ncbi:MAG: hypothetical protein LBL45_06230, partial [Treponema sp.]|nr:hypothetical protein [Treponema sp.]
PFGAVSYLRRYDNGSGGYAKDREKPLEGVTMDDIKREVSASKPKLAATTDIEPMIHSATRA